MKKAFAVLVVNVTIFIVLLCLLELLIRIFVPEINLSGLDKRLLKDNVYYTSRGMIANTSGSNYGYTFKTDSNGFARYHHSNKTGKRTLYIGDSVTMGIGVEEDSTFAGIINNKQQYQVFNPSLIGYARQDYLNIINKLVVEQKNNLEISGVNLFWCLNDVYNFYPENTSPEIKYTGITGSVLSFFKNNFKLFQFIKNTFTDRPKSYYLYDEQFYKPGNKLFNESVSDIVKISEILKEAKITFRVYLLPYEYQLRKGICKPQLLLSDSLKAYNIRIYDVASFLAKQKDYQDLYLYGDGIHFSKKGHRLIAEYLSR